MFQRVIWQYWETVGEKPAFVDGLYTIAKKNAGAEVILVTPQTLRDYLPSIPDALFDVSHVVHRADMIRAMLVARHGGLWLNSDAVVLRRLDWILDLLDDYEFVGFKRQRVTVSCFASRANGTIVKEWVRQQHAKFPQREFSWMEVGTDLLDPICHAHQERVKVMPFRLIGPVLWDEVADFCSSEIDVRPILRDSYTVMLSAQSLRTRVPELYQMTVNEIAAGGTLLSTIMRRALNHDGESPFVPPRE